MSAIEAPASRPWRVTLRGDEYDEVKDPCPVHDGERWHLYGTGIRAGLFDVLHATSAQLEGPWHVHSPAALPALPGGCVAAPGVVAEGGTLHMFLQSDFSAPGGRVEHLVSVDGARFAHLGTALTSLPGTEEAGIYDPHPAQIAGERYLSYSAFATVGSPDVHLARSVSGEWSGPWERLGAILRHEDVPFHNARGAKDYEWGLEGAQLSELPDGRVLLSAVCFLPDGGAGSRQRVFLATADSPLGPFELSGPLTPPGPGENGHACAVPDGDTVAVLMQSRDPHEPSWRYELLRIPLERLDTAIGLDR